MKFPVITPPMVLVASDDLISGRMVGETLAGAGYRVANARLESGFPAGEGVKPDLVVACWITPALDGAMVIQSIKGMECFQRVPVLVATEKVVSPLKQEILRGMGLPLLATPWQPEDLFIRLEQLAMCGGK